jgi:hypothetical protein
MNGVQALPNVDAIALDQAVRRIGGAARTLEQVGDDPRVREAGVLLREVILLLDDVLEQPQGSFAPTPPLRFGR